MGSCAASVLLDPSTVLPQGLCHYGILPACCSTVCRSIRYLFFHRSGVLPHWSAPPVVVFYQVLFLRLGVHPWRCSLVPVLCRCVVLVLLPFTLLRCHCYTCLLFHRSIGSAGLVFWICIGRLLCGLGCYVAAPSFWCSFYWLAGLPLRCWIGSTHRLSQTTMFITCSIAFRFQGGHSSFFKARPA